MSHSIYLTNVFEELVAEAFAVGSALYKACNVHETDGSRGRLLGIIHLMQNVQAFIRNSYYAYIGFDGAEGEVGRFCSGLSDGIKEGALAHVGQAHNADF
jgi:hypothetical protein